MLAAVTASSANRSRPGLAARIGRLSKILVIASAFAYPAMLALCVLAFRFVGESFWLTALALYAPRLAFALPLPFLAVALLVVRRPRLLWTQALAAFLVVVPLMGLVIPKPSLGRGGEPALRVMTFNVMLGYAGYSGIFGAIEQHSPDLFLAQESVPWGGFDEMLKRRYPHLNSTGQFVLASRYPILEATEPERIPHLERERSPRFMRYLIQAPFGPVAVYNMHPISARGTFGVWRLRDGLRAVKNAVLMKEDPSAAVAAYTGLREAQVRLAAEMAKKERHPVIFAGDFNLPSLSRIFHDHLGEYQDGFAEAGSGFGYTYPDRFPFMRIDRVLASPAFRFTGFEVGCRGISDHFCVIAELVPKDAP